MIRIELKHIKKGGFFSFELNTNATKWMKGERNSNKRQTWVYNKDCAALVDPDRKVYTRIEYIKPSKAIDVFNLEYV